MPINRGGPTDSTDSPNQIKGSPGEGTAHTKTGKGAAVDWKTIVGVLSRCKDDATVALLMRARSATSEQGRTMSRVYGIAAENLRREGRYGEARFMERIAGIYEANRLVNGAVEDGRYTGEEQPNAA